LRCRISVNSHTLSFYDIYSWFYSIMHRFYVSGVFYGKKAPTEIRTHDRSGFFFGIKTPNRILAFLAVVKMTTWFFECVANCIGCIRSNTIKSCLLWSRKFTWLQLVLDKILENLNQFIKNESKKCITIQKISVLFRNPAIRRVPIVMCATTKV
jgi:hypothetical protein